MSLLYVTCLGRSLSPARVRDTEEGRWGVNRLWQRNVLADRSHFCSEFEQRETGDLVEGRKRCWPGSARPLAGNRAFRRLRLKNTSSTLFSTALGYSGIGLVFCKLGLICSLWCYISVPTSSGVGMLHIRCAGAVCLPAVFVRAREQHPTLAGVKAKSWCITRLVRWSQGMWDVYTQICMYRCTYLHTYTYVCTCVYIWEEQIQTL